MIIVALPLASAPAVGDAKNVEAATVINKTLRGAESVRASLRNDTGRPIVVVAADVKSYAALDSSDPEYNRIPPDLTPSRSFHAMGGPCLYQFSGATSMTVTDADGHQTITSFYPAITPRPTFSTASYEVIASGESKLVGPIEHFDNFDCGEIPAHVYRVYSVVGWRFQDAPAASELQTLSSPTVTVSIP